MLAILPFFQSAEGSCVSDAVWKPSVDATQKKTSILLLSENRGRNRKPNERTRTIYRRAFPCKVAKQSQSKSVMGTSTVAAM